METDNKNTVSWLKGFLIGGSIGAAIAMLMAPRSGEDTREMIRERSIEMRDQAMDTYDDGWRRVEALAGEARERLMNLKSVSAELADEQKKLLKEGAEKARRAVEEAEKEPAAA